VHYELHGWSPKTYSPALKREIGSRLQDRIMFGCDYSSLTSLSPLRLDLHAVWAFSASFDESITSDLETRRLGVAHRRSIGTA
jgi:hypothetical protein